jgi:hypothetical protein
MMENNDNTHMPKSPSGDSKIGSIIEKYFEGLTSLEEEQFLRDYFQGENVAEEFAIHKPMFQFFSDARFSTGSDFQAEEKIYIPHQRFIRSSFSIWKWASIAVAASFLLFMGLRLIFNIHKPLPETSEAYIDGKKYTDILLIQEEALKALENLSESNDDIFSSQIEALDLFFE